MDRVIKIFDWWDGPVEGLAEFEGKKCIFQRIFDVEADEWMPHIFWITTIPEGSIVTYHDWELFKAEVTEETGDRFYTFLSDKLPPSSAPEGYHKFKAAASFQFDEKARFTADIMKAENNLVKWSIQENDR